jgi:hypothetical protein
VAHISLCHPRGPFKSQNSSCSHHGKMQRHAAGGCMSTYPKHSPSAGSLPHTWLSMTEGPVPQRIIHYVIKSFFIRVNF